MHIKPFIYVLLCGGLLGVLACTSQPQGHCQVAQKLGEAHFAVYTPLTPMEGAACADKELKAERIGFETYQLPGQSQIGIAWRTETLQQRFDAAVEAHVWSAEKAQEESISLNVVADYSSKPDAENRCYVFDDNNPADPRSFGLVKEFVDDGVSPTTTYVYEWRDVVVYSLPASPGQLVEGEVSYSMREEGGSTCTGVYSFVALWPAYGCNSDEDCEPSVRGQAGSPINPDFAGSLQCHLLKAVEGLPKEEKAGYCTIVGSAEALIQKLAE
ncbi:MAG: hypothetical protein FWG75_01840 [Cystobacterineae bacterium]|nr:hypothetical protein [Cystobacterineae bacterium]